MLGDAIRAGTTPIWFSKSRRRGEEEARTSCKDIYPFREYESELFKLAGLSGFSYIAKTCAAFNGINTK